MQICHAPKVKYSYHCMSYSKSIFTVVSVSRQLSQAGIKELAKTIHGGDEHSDEETHPSDGKKISASRSADPTLQTADFQKRTLSNLNPNKMSFKKSPSHKYKLKLKDFKVLKLIGEGAFGMVHVVKFEDANMIAYYDSMEGYKRFLI